MKSLWKRFQYYGIGLMIGLMFTFIFFQNRGCSWLPENRVKNAILENVIVFKSTDINAMTTLGITPEDYIEILNKGDIKFGLSKRQGEPKFYYGKHKTNGGEEIYAQFELRVDGFVSLCKPLQKDEVVVSENILNGEAVIYRLPLDTTLVAFDDKLALCQAKELGISEQQVLNALQNKGIVNYDLSDLENLDKPLYHLIFTINGERYEGKAIWYKNKVFFTYFFHSGIEKC